MRISIYELELKTKESFNFNFIYFLNEYLKCFVSFNGIKDLQKFAFSQNFSIKIQDFIE